MDTLPIASVWRRLFALVYDALILIALLMVATAIAMLVAELALPDVSASHPDAVRQHPVYLVWLLLWWFGYYAGCWRRGGQTIGMKAWRLRLISVPRPVMGWSQCLLRFVTGLLGVGLLLALLHPERSSIQDLMSGTRVIQLAKAGR